MDLDVNDAIGSDKGRSGVSLTQQCSSGESNRTIRLFARGGFAAPLWQLCRHLHELLLLFHVESTFVGYVATAYCVCLSLVKF